MYFVFQSGHFVGSSPTKSALTKYQNFEKKIEVQKIEFFLQNLGPKITQNDVIWSQAYRKMVFLTIKKF